MKRHHVVILGGAGLVLAFVVGGYLYKSWQADEIESMAHATTEESPLRRSYAHSTGPADAKVTLVEFFDPGCETCRAFAPHVDQLMQLHSGKVRHVRRYAPFHQGADTMVKILEAARRQGLYEEALQVMFDTQRYWADHHRPQPDNIWQFLPAAGLDVEQIRKDMNDPAISRIIEQDMADAKTLGVHKTPEFIVNGKRLPSFGLPQLQELLNSEVAAAYSH